jgi:hypothetical protein
MKKTISEVLLRRNELKRQTDLRAALEKQANIFEPHVSRRLISEVSGMEQVEAVLPKCSKAQVERERDYYSHQWRLADQAVQQANHTTRMPIPASVMKDYVSDEEMPTGDVEETLAALLSRRKGLELKVTETVRNIDTLLFVEKVSARLKITDSLDTVVKNVEVLPAYKLLGKQLHYLKQLRLCETAIQRINSTTEIEVPESVFVDFV